MTSRRKPIPTSSIALALAAVAFAPAGAHSEDVSISGTDTDTTDLGPETHEVTFWMPGFNAPAQVVSIAKLPSTGGGGCSVYGRCGTMQPL